MLSRDALLADVSRALRASRPDAADDLLREIESRCALSSAPPSSLPSGGGQGEGSQSHQPRVTRGRLIEELAPLLTRSFPARAEDLLRSLSAVLWPGGVLGPVSVLSDTPSPALDLTPDEWPSFVVLSPSHFGLRLLLHLESMTLGARADVELPLAGAGLSPRHVLLTQDASGGVLVEDLSDGRALAVNAKATSWAWMQAGDRVRCGDLELRFVPALTTPAAPVLGPGAT